MSHSANISWGCGCEKGFLDRVSGALLRVPLIHSAVKLYPMILVFSRSRRRFSISSNLWLFRIGMSGWWSVTMVKWGSPARKRLHLLMAHDTVSSSSSIMA